MKTEILTLNRSRNVTLTAYIQAVGGEFRYVSRRPAVLVLPGGGYQMCSDREADPVACAYLEAGYQVFILRYSVGDGSVWPNPLDDYELAMGTIRSKADEWNLYPDKIAVIGFSAGGHLAACAAALSKNRPNAAILGYAVTAGETVRECCPTAPDVIGAVDRKTCPCFLFATRDDNVVDIANSIQMMDALAKAGISFESHIYAYGPHGFSTGDTSIQDAASGLCPRAKNWVPDSIGWLRDMFGDFGSNGMTEPACKPHVNGNAEEYLSVDCTIGHLLNDPEARNILEPILSRSGQSMDHIGGIILRMKLRDAMRFGQASEEDIQSVNTRLSGIRNG